MLVSSPASGEENRQRSPTPPTPHRKNEENFLGMLLQDQKKQSLNLTEEPLFNSRKKMGSSGARLDSDNPITGKITLDSAALKDLMKN